MTIIEISFGRAFRVWWSYAWRALALSLVVFIPLQILFFSWILPHIHAATARHDHRQMRQVLELVGFIWPIAIIFIVILQTAAMRWMLRRARWSDFKLTASPVSGSSDA